jgi:hypothetical protein
MEPTRESEQNTGRRHPHHSSQLCLWLGLPCIIPAIFTKVKGKLYAETRHGKEGAMSPVGAGKIPEE